MPRDITPEQRRVFDALAHLIKVRDGRPPSYQQIADSVGLAKSTVRHHVARLAAAGWVELPPLGEARGLRVLARRSS
ncbi:LexA family protein [Actinomycetospora aeridis]|uniref:Helix-turn-helix domain-containing protein n=1 Tax=Actinomycetospora aeridis TaxID=3129231 RepID=A0ABU8N163_9PSEU